MLFLKKIYKVKIKINIPGADVNANVNDNVEMLIPGFLNGAFYCYKEYWKRQGLKLLRYGFHKMPKGETESNSKIQQHVLWILRNFQDQIFYRKPPDNCFWQYNSKIRYRSIYIPQHFAVIENSTMEADIGKCCLAVLLVSNYYDEILIHGKALEEHLW